MVADVNREFCSQGWRSKHKTRMDLAGGCPARLQVEGVPEGGSYTGTGFELLLPSVVTVVTDLIFPCFPMSAMFVQRKRTRAVNAKYLSSVQRYRYSCEVTRPRDRTGALRGVEPPVEPQKAWPVLYSLLSPRPAASENVVLTSTHVHGEARCLAIAGLGKPRHFADPSVLLSQGDALQSGQGKPCTPPPYPHRCAPRMQDNVYSVDCRAIEGRVAPTVDKVPLVDTTPSPVTGLSWCVLAGVPLLVVTTKAGFGVWNADANELLAHVPLAPADVSTEEGAEGCRECLLVAPRPDVLAARSYVPLCPRHRCAARIRRARSGDVVGRSDRSGRAAEGPRGVCAPRHAQARSQGRYCGAGC